MAYVLSEGLNPLNLNERSLYKTEFRDDKQIETVQKFCAENGYQLTIRNPDYDSSDPESQQMIANPEGPGSFLWRKTFEWWASFVRAYDTKQGQLEVAQQVAERVQQDLSEIQYGVPVE